MSLTNKQLRKLIKEEISLLRESTQEGHNGLYRAGFRDWRHPECESPQMKIQREVCVSLKIIEALESLGVDLKPYVPGKSLKDWFQERHEEYEKWSGGRIPSAHWVRQEAIKLQHRYEAIVGKPARRRRSRYPDISIPTGKEINFDLKDLKDLDLDPEIAGDLDAEMQKLLDAILNNDKKRSKKK